MSIASRLITIESESCGSCGVIFGLEASFMAERKRDGQSFYCPSGDKVSYSNSENKRLRESLEAAQRAAIYAREDRDRARVARVAAERSAAAHKGVATRLKRRGAAGVCVLGCNRHFADVERHNRTRHPAEMIAALA